MGNRYGYTVHCRITHLASDVAHGFRKLSELSRNGRADQHNEQVSKIPKKCRRQAQPHHQEAFYRIVTLVVVIQVPMRF